MGQIQTCSNTKIPQRQMPRNRNNGSILLYRKWTNINGTMKKTAREIALKIEKDFQKYFHVKYEFKNAVEDAMKEYARQALIKQIMKCAKNCHTGIEKISVLSTPLIELK